MNDLLKRPGYRLYPPDSPEGRELLDGHGLTSADVDQALLRHHEARGTRIDTIVGLNEDGVFGAAGEPAPRHQTVVPLLWLQVLELLGRVPEGSTARFLEDGTLPADRP
jgi:hypothetical protein